MNHNRTWAQLKAADRASISLNPLRNWVETVMPQLEKDAATMQRPDNKIVFLLGDPTLYETFSTPKEYKEFACESVGQVDGYTDFFGDVTIRRELAKTLSSERWQLSEQEIVLTAGGSGALFYATMALASPGDKILMPRPTFPLVKGFADFLGIEVVFYDLSPQTWQPNIIELEQILVKHPDIKFILINSPSNPLGSVFTPESIKGIIEFCERHNNLPIVSDEIYEEMIFDGPDQFKFLSEYTTNVPILRCSGLTKRCLVPGWRLGWMAMYGKGDSLKQVKEAIRHVANILLMPNTIAQRAAIQVYKASSPIIAGKMVELQNRYKAFRHGLDDAYGISVGTTSGAMYATFIVNVNEFADIADSSEFARKLQLEENVLVFPGELFYGHNFVRFVICVDIPVIEEACTRIKRFTLRHKK